MDIKERRKQYYLNNREKILEKSKQYYHDNKDKILEKSKIQIKKKLHVKVDVNLLSIPCTIPCYAL